jgi:hypothetical protein
MISFHPPIHAPERVTRTCALGLRFLDVATGAVVANGLRASAWPIPSLASGSDVRQGAREATLSPSGVLAFHALPGLRDFENSDAADPWQTSYRRRDFQVEVTDRCGRFLPCTFPITAPIEGLAVFQSDDSPPSTEAGAAPLFSAASRIPPAGLAVVRGELRLIVSGRPAAWTLVEARYVSAGMTRTARGLADENGHLLLLFPYPEGQRRAFNGSPPGATGGLSEQQWSLDLSFCHHPTSVAERMADYSTRLTQPPVQAWRGASALTTVGRETLQFGRELELGVVELEEPLSPP